MKREIISLCCALGVATLSTFAQQDSIKKIKLDEVVVNSIRAGAQSAVAHSDLNMQQVQSLSINGDVPAVLSLLPSITATSESGTGLGATSMRIRGTDPSRINVTLNGVQMNDAESQGVFWQNLPDLLSSIGSLQVQRGVGTSTNGVASFGGSINMDIMSPSEKPYASVWGAAGSYGTLEYAALTGTGVTPAGFSFDARHINVLSNGYIDRTGVSNTGFTGVAGWQNDKNYIRAFFMYGEQHTGLFGGTPKDSLKNNRRYNPAGEYVTSDGATHYYGNEKDNYTQGIAQLNYVRVVNSSWTLSGTLHAAIGNGYYEQYKRGATLDSYGLPKQQVIINGRDTLLKKSDLVRQKWLQNVALGAVASATYKGRIAEVNLGAAYQWYDGAHFGNVIWSQYNDGSIPNNHEYYRNTGMKNDANVFAKTSVDLTKEISLFADAQLRYASLEMSGRDDSYYYELDTMYRWWFFNPKVGMHYQIADKHSTYASFGVAGREPNRSDLKDAGQTAEITTSPTTERLYDFEMGYRFATGETLLSANLFYMHYRDQIVHSGRLNDSYRPVMVNVPESYRRGLELVAGTKLFKKLAAEANLTLSQNKIKDFTTQTYYYDSPDTWNKVGNGYLPETYSKVDIAYSPNVIASGALRYNFTDRLAFTLMGKYVGDQYMDNTQSAERMIDSYFVCNTRLSFDFDVKNIGGVHAQLLVNNIFNNQYESFGYVNEYEKFADGTQILDTRYNPQAGTNAMLKLMLKF